MAYNLYDLNGLKITLLYISLALQFVILCYFLFVRWSPFLCEHTKMQVYRHL